MDRYEIVHLGEYGVSKVIGTSTDRESAEFTARRHQRQFGGSVRVMLRGTVVYTVDEQGQETRLN